MNIKAYITQGNNLYRIREPGYQNQLTVHQGISRSCPGPMLESVEDGLVDGLDSYLATEGVPHPQKQLSGNLFTFYSPNHTSSTTWPSNSHLLDFAWHVAEKIPISPVPPRPVPPKTSASSPRSQSVPSHHPKGRYQSRPSRRLPKPAVNRR